MRKVLIATPSLYGSVSVYYAESLVRTIKLAAELGVQVFPVMLSFEALLLHARNELVRIGIEQKFDDVVFIDDDEGWEPEWFFRLLGHSVDVVGAPVRKKSDAEELYNVRSGTMPVPVDPATGLLIVDGIGTGFLRISSRALMALWVSSTPYMHHGKDHRMVFELQVSGAGDLVSEDNVMCARLSALGFPLYVDPAFTVRHVGVKSWEGDFQGWLARLEATHATPPAPEVQPTTG